MPALEFSKKRLLRLMGKSYSDAELTELLPKAKAFVDAIDGDAATIEVTGDRPDLLSAAGIARSAKGQSGKATGLPDLKLEKPELEVRVHADALAVRAKGAGAPHAFVVGLVATGLDLDEDLVAELFRTQDKLDFVLGRRRRKVSIGLYDLKNLKGPLEFKLASDTKTSFTPLMETGKHTLRHMLEHHPKGVGYKHLLPDKGSLPVFADSKGEILSLVPIINNVESAITAKTTRLFIDHTGTDEHAMNASLNIWAQDLADLGATVHAVTITYLDDKGKPVRETITPDAAPMDMQIGVTEASKLLGVKLTGKQVTMALGKQRIGASVQGEFVHAKVPRYRADFLHPVDLVEEIMLGVGLENLTPVPPQTFVAGALHPLTHLSRQARNALLGTGGFEVANYCLTNVEKAKRAHEPQMPIELSNPVSTEYNALRNSLIPNLLELLSKNTRYAYPQNVFEVGDTVVLASEKEEPEVRSKTFLSASFATAHASASFTHAATALDSLARQLGRQLELKPLTNDSHKPQFIDGRSAKVFLDGVECGVLGELHPAVLENFGLLVPVALFDVKLAQVAV